MLKQEDYHQFPTSGIIPFDIELFIEGHLRNIAKVDDLRDFTYDNTVLRPRHVIAVNDVLQKYTNKLMLMQSPLGIWNGRQLEVKSRRFDTFVDLIVCLEDLCQTQDVVFLYSVQRNSGVELNAFGRKVQFCLRYAD